MAFDFSKLNFFSRLEARDRVFVLLGAVLGVIGLIYLLTSYFSGSQATIGPSQVANAPKNLQSVPGGALTAEYSKALQQANADSAKQAQMSGTSAVPTLMNFGDSTQAGTGGCVVCSDKNVNIKSALDEWVRKGLIQPGVATDLQQLANKKVPVSEFEVALAKLLKEGKITPEQARDLLDRYKKQYENNLLDESTAAMDPMIQAGSLPVEVASDLLAAQKGKMSAEKYADKVNQLINQGKISPEIGRQLVAQYRQQLNRETTNDRVTMLHEMSKHGELIPEVENAIVKLEKRNAPLQEYADTLHQMVADGKITPAIAEKLINGYRDSKLNALGSNLSADQRVQQGEQKALSSLDELVKAKTITADTAQTLSNLIKRNVSNDEYQDAVRKLVQQGKLPPELAQAKIDEYSDLKRLREATNQQSEQTGLDRVKKAEDGLYKSLDDNVQNNKISADTARQLSDLAKQNVSADEYAAAVQKLANDGKIPPDVAASTVEAYKSLKVLRDTPDSLQMIRKTEEDTYRGLDALTKNGKITKDAANQLSDMIQKGASPEEMKNALDAMVAKGQTSAPIAQALMDQYAKVKQMRDMRDNLKDLQANNVPLDQYKQALKTWVAQGVITPEQATQLLKDYQIAQANHVNAGVPGGGNQGANMPEGNSLLARIQRGAIQAGAERKKLIGQSSASGARGNPDSEASLVDEFTRGSVAQKLLNRNQGGGGQGRGGARGQGQGQGGQGQINAQSEAEAQAQAAQELAQAQQAATQEMMAAMQSQAGQLVGSWQPPAMQHTQGQGDAAKNAAAKNASSSTSQSASSTTTAAKGPPLIKAGTITFGVLDTEANSDYADSPIMATIVDGPLKGGKLMGKLVTTKSISGQQDRISLNFTLMNYDKWTNSKGVTAYAVDPETARTALATSVDYHYLQKFGAMMATSFLTGYASSITQAGTSTTGIFGTSTTHPSLSPADKILTAMGQMGTTLGNATQNYVNMPPTVKIEAGVGIGILFMADVTE